jgi:hypothetical protein
MVQTGVFQWQQKHQQQQHVINIITNDMPEEVDIGTDYTTLWELIVNDWMDREEEEEQGSMICTMNKRKKSKV